MTQYYYDPIYGQIVVDEMYYPIVDSYYFKRLRHLRQLGLCYLSFPGGNHTRYEHSLGAFHLATLMEKVIKYGDIKDDDKPRLIALLKLGTLCHDIGHGPFSHMIENALHGEGVKISHEEVGAAIVCHKLKAELKPFEDKYGITSNMISQLMTKSAKDEPLLKCAEELVSSDVDLDRIDYLYRDSHYCGKHAGSVRQQMNFENIWELSDNDGIPRFELTNDGINYAEDILILRKNNYSRIVFESKHMGLTAMFEKAVQLAAEYQDSEFGKRCKIVKETSMEWNDSISVTENFPKIWGSIYGLFDYQAFNLIEECPDRNVRSIIREIRSGDCYPSKCRYGWEDIHYLTKKVILSLKNDKDAYQLRRNIENELSKLKGIESYQIAVHLQKYSVPKPIISGTIKGRLLEEVSGLSRFLIDDVKSQYVVELFLDKSISKSNEDVIKNNFKDMICQGKINKIK